MPIARFLSRYATPAVLTTAMFLLNGCGSKSPSEKTGEKSTKSNVVGDSKKPSSGTPGANASPEDEVKAALTDMVASFEKQDFQRFFELYAPVEMLRDIRQGDGLRTVVADAKRRAKNRQAELNEFIAPMKAALKAKPIFTAENTMATFIVVATPEQTIEAGKVPILAVKNKNPPQDAYSGDLTAVITAAIADLEAGKADRYLVKMLPASELKLHDLPQLVQRFKSTPGVVQQTIADLKSIKDKKPEFEDGGNTAVITVPVPPRKLFANSKPIPVEPRVFKFQKVGGHWRLYDNTTAMQTASKTYSRTIPAETKTVVLEKIGNHWRLAPQDEEYGGRSVRSRRYEKSAAKSYDPDYGRKKEERFEPPPREFEKTPAKTGDFPRFPDRKTEAKTEAAKPDTKLDGR